MSKFSKDYEKSETFLLKNKKEINQIRRFIENALIPYIKQLQEDNPDLNIEDFYTLLETDAFMEFATTAFKSTYSLDYYMLYIACEYLEKHPDLCRDLYEKFNINNLSKSSKKFSSSHMHTLDEYIERFMYYVVPAYENALDAFNKTLEHNPELADALKVGKNSRELDLFIKSIRSPIQKRQIQKFIKFYSNGLIAFLPEYKSNIEKEIRYILSASISEIAKQLNRLHLFEKYNDIEDRNYQRLNLPELASSIRNFDLTNQELLKKLSIHELMILNSFWINRYAKELNNYSTGILTIYNLGLLPNILNNTFSTSDLNPDNISEIFKKSCMLKFNSQFFMDDMYAKYLKGQLAEVTYSCSMKEMFQKILSGELQGDRFFDSEDGNFIVYPFTEFAESMRKRYGKEYDDFFKFLPGSNKIDHYADKKKKGTHIIESDADLYGRLISPVFNIYSTKDEILCGLVYNLQNNADIVNAGIIPDGISENGSEIYLNPNFICLGLDAKLTFPVTEHIKLSVLIEFLEQLNETEDIFIPLYEGHNDFTYKSGTHIAAQQIFPTTKEFEKTLRKLAASNPSSKLVSHLNWLIKPSNVPEEHKASEVNAKGKTKKRYLRRYVNLSEYEEDKPLQIYIFKDDKYIPIQESGITFSGLDSIVHGDGNDGIGL